MSSVVLSQVTLKRVHFMQLETNSELRWGKKVDRRVPHVPFAIEHIFFDL